MKIDRKKLVDLLVSSICTGTVTILVWKLRIPNPNVILITVIVFFTSSGGFVSGIPSAMITLLYSVFFFLLKNFTVENEQKMVVIGIFIPLIVLLVGILKNRNDVKSEELIVANRKLEILVNEDDLTHMPNRRFLDRVCRDEYVRAARTTTPVSFVMIDIDFFKQYNDMYGHLQGDECLKRIAAAISDNTQRTGDYAARYGGEEFLLVLPNTETCGAEIICKRIQTSINELCICHCASSISGRVTVSFGIACSDCNETDNYLDLVACADRALYKAKENGRNKIVSAEQLCMGQTI
ncbi:MAG: GGDEF domain-containing protein [Treponema sp.]|nr:GGDEF domain-containing protein [Treponema sp.]